MARGSVSRCEPNGKGPDTMTMKLPPLQKVVQVLEALLGKKPQVGPVPAPKLLKLDKPPKGTYVALWTDDDQKVVGCIAADLAAALFLGGSLAMVPQRALQEQLKTGLATDSVLDGLSEVFNNVTASVNYEPDNPHVRSITAELFTAPSAARDTEWVGKPAVRLDLLGASPIGEWRIVLLAR